MGNDLSLILSQALTNPDTLILGLENGVLGDSAPALLGVLEAHWGEEGEERADLAFLAEQFGEALRKRDFRSVESYRGRIVEWLSVRKQHLERIFPKIGRWKGVDRFEPSAHLSRWRRPSMSVPLHAGAGLQATSQETPVSRIGGGDNSLSARVDQMIRDDMKSFQSGAPGLVGAVPGLTPDWEEAFLWGRRVRFVVEKDGEKIYFRNTIGSDRLTPATKEEFEIFQAWLERMGFPADETASSEGPEIKMLRAFIESKGARLNLEVPLTPTQALYILKLLQKLSDRFYQGGYFRELRFEGGKDGELSLENYNKGVLTLSSETLKGSRRDLMGALLHGLGHATADRYGVAGLPTDPDSLPYDSTIPFEDRRDMNGAFFILRQNFMGNFYALNWPVLAPFRTAYLAQAFPEFFAEMQFILMVDPDGLRQHIAKLDTVPQLMYENIVRELLKYIRPS